MPKKKIEEFLKKHPDYDKAGYAMYAHLHDCPKCSVSVEKACPTRVLQADETLLCDEGRRLLHEFTKESNKIHSEIMEVAG